jgi:hypothetical protein
MKVFPSAPAEAVPPAFVNDPSAPDRSVWVRAVWRIACGAVFLGVSTLYRLVLPDASHSAFMIAGFVGFIAFLALTKSAGFTQGSDSPDIRAGLKPSSLMADATGWTGLMGLIGIASIGSVHGYLLIG